MQGRPGSHLGGGPGLGSWQPDTAGKEGDKGYCYCPLGLKGSGKGCGFRSLGVEGVRKLEKGIESWVRMQKIKKRGAGDLGTDMFRRVVEAVKV